MSNFKDRTVGNNFKVVYNGEVYSAQIDRSNSSMHENTTDEEGNTVVKKLNAANLNAAFAEKQDRLIAGQGIKIENNNISCEHGFLYPKLAPAISANTSVYTVDEENWSMSFVNPTEPRRSAKYLAELGGAKNCSVEFELENMHFTADDADPTVTVKFGDRYCLFRLKLSGIRMVDSSWTTIEKQSGLSDKLPIISEGKSIKVRIVRMKNTEGKDEFTFFFNEKKLGVIAIETLGFVTVSIGTVGCKADKIKNYRFEHIG